MSRAFPMQISRFFSASAARPAVNSQAERILSAISQSKQQPSTAARSLGSSFREAASVRPRKALAHAGQPPRFLGQRQGQFPVSQASPEAIQAQQDKEDMERLWTRRWAEGDIYSPHDLSAPEMRKWRKPVPRASGSQDVCDMVGINPLHHYKNFAIMSEYITETGRILPRSRTGLRPVNHRRMAKAIKRAIGCGLMPSVHKHPEILRIYMDRSEGKKTTRRGKRVM